jgi:hypothetical protein
MSRRYELRFLKYEHFILVFFLLNAISNIDHSTNNGVVFLLKYVFYYDEPFNNALRVF